MPMSRKISSRNHHLFSEWKFSTNMSLWCFNLIWMEILRRTSSNVINRRQVWMHSSIWGPKTGSSLLLSQRWSVIKDRTATCGARFVDNLWCTRRNLRVQSYIWFWPRRPKNMGMFDQVLGVCCKGLCRWSAGITWFYTPYFTFSLLKIAVR